MKYLLIIPFVWCGSLLAQPYALKQLEDSPRHHEWVEVTYDNRTVHSLIVYPEINRSTLVAMVIHENRGLTDWVRSFADQLAEAGYIAIAPDLLSDFDENFRRTSDFASQDDARNALSRLNPDQVTRDLKAVLKVAKTIPSANGKVVVMGFCWGGSQAFRFATNDDKHEAAIVFYGTAPTDSTVYASIQAPVYGFYGGNDQRVNATIPVTESWMKSNNKSFKYRIYPGAGHGYMRTGDDPEGSEDNVKGRNESWKWLKEILSGI